MKTSVKTQETNLKSNKNCKGAEFSVTKILEEDGDSEKMSGREREKKNAEIWSHFSLLKIYIIKINKVKRYF